MANSTTANGGIILTVPANSNWNGIIALGASLVVGPGSSAASTTPSVTVVGNAANFNDGDTLAALQLASSAALVTALTGTQVVDSVAVGPFNLQTAANSVSVRLNVTGAGASAIAAAVGQVL